MKKTNTVNFDRENRTITFDGEVIIDLKSVVAQTKAKLFSKSDTGTDTEGFYINFSISEGMIPFNFGCFSLGVAGFIAAVIENKLEIKGMNIHDGLEDAYRHVWMYDQRVTRTKPNTFYNNWR